jgi:hypothetical protein
MLTLVITSEDAILFSMTKWSSLHIFILIFFFINPSWGAKVSFFEVSKSRTAADEKKEEIKIHVYDILKNLSSTFVQNQISPYEITFIFTSLITHEGVFYPPGRHPILKGEKQLVIELNASILKSSNYLRLITHELFHAIHFVLNPREVAWVREGLAQYFEYKIHGSINDRNLLSALRSSTTPLVSDYDINQYDPEQYGHNFLYFFYLVRNCSSQQDDFFWDLVTEKSDPNHLSDSGIDFVLKKQNSSKSMCTSFLESASKFELARVINQYSGVQQSRDTFIISHVEGIGVNLFFEKNFLQMNVSERKNFFKELPPFLPLHVRGEMWEEMRSYLAEVLNSSGKIYKFLPYFPFSYNEIKLDSLTNESVYNQHLIIFKTN